MTLPEAMRRAGVATSSRMVGLAWRTARSILKIDARGVIGPAGWYWSRFNGKWRRECGDGA